MKDILAKLQEEKHKIMQQLQTNGLSSEEHDVGDDIDNSVEEQTYRLRDLLGDRERAKLEQINDALRRFESGEYGYCDECGDPIAPKRLKALPFARMCVECQQQTERQYYQGSLLHNNRGYYLEENDQ
ncbi:TraR/DksA family transcriptional regulator [Deltaproteobacteria bacterium TL4]